MDPLSARHYGVIGNHASCALIHPSGSIDWLCLPYLDSPSHFGTLINREHGGRFQIVPQGEFKSKQYYLSRTLILETLFETKTGRAVLLDWMPVGHPLFPGQTLCRRIQMIEGRISWNLICAPRFDYGAAPAQTERTHSAILFRHEGHDLAILFSKGISLQISEKGDSAHSQFTLDVGQQAQWTWSWGREGVAIGLSSTIETIFDLAPQSKTIEYWRKQAHTCPSSECVFRGPWHELITQSGLLIKLACSSYTGAIPQSILSRRELSIDRTHYWAPRHACLRNGFFKLQTLASLGLLSEARNYFYWLKGILERDGVEKLQALYQLDGARATLSKSLFSNRLELDIYGHVFLALCEYARLFGEFPEELWPKMVEIADFICQVWRKPDYGPWEETSKPDHFLVSKLFCWATLKEALWLANFLGKPIPARWRHEKAVLFKVICSEGYDSKQNSFVSSFGSLKIDHSCLWVCFLNFLPMDDVRVQGTVLQVETQIKANRFPKGALKSGPPIHDIESALFLISARILSGNTQEAAEQLKEILDSANSLGFFEGLNSIGSLTSLNHFPNIDIHFSFIQCALYLGWARNQEKFPNYFSNRQLFSQSFPFGNQVYEDKTPYRKRS